VVNNCTVSTDEAIREPAPRAKVAMLLAAETYSLISHDIASEATSADKYRDRDRDTTRAPLRGDMATALREYRARGTRSCLSLSRSSSAPSRGPVERSSKSLRSGQDRSFRGRAQRPGTSASERLLALKFLLYLVGDLYQRLRAADDHDAGGNKKPVAVTELDPSNLHGGRA
jgi:hypothetical protein